MSELEQINRLLEDTMRQYNLTLTLPASNIDDLVAEVLAECEQAQNTAS